MIVVRRKRAYIAGCPVEAGLVRLSLFMPTTITIQGDGLPARWAIFDDLDRGEHLTTLRNGSKPSQPGEPDHQLKLFQAVRESPESRCQRDLNPGSIVFASRPSWNGERDGRTVEGQVQMGFVRDSGNR